MSSSSERHRPARKWGQNFLRNPGAIRRIVDSIEAVPGELVLEIGPGEGALTREIAARGIRLAAIEIDPKLQERLEADLGDRIELIRGDATVVPLPSEPFVAVGNLPYNVANPIIRRVIASPNFRRAVFMVQKEVAERLTAEPGDDGYGFLTLAVKLFATATVLMTLEPGSFHPRPKVRSSVVIFRRHDPQIGSDREGLLALISDSFRSRRKKLSNNLLERASKETVERALAACGLASDARAEQLSLAAFDCLAKHLN